MKLKLHHRGFLSPVTVRHLSPKYHFQRGKASGRCNRYYIKLANRFSYRSREPGNSKRALMQILC